MIQPSPGLHKAIDDFRLARRQAVLEQILARLTGRPADLLSYNEVRRLLKAEGQIERGLEEIPLDAIVGSVGRYNDFTRYFLPRKDSIGERWARVKVAATDATGWPPIDVYKLGEVYFVLDGNHRVSVARQLGMHHIQAYVTEVRTKVPLTPDVGPDELICKAQHAAFLERTNLDRLRPEADMSVTAPGAYRTLDEHIAVHRYFMGLEQQREIPYEKAVTHWYDTVYRPVVEIIRQKGLLRDFPKRTETDLYLWLAEHRAELQEALGWEVEPDLAADDLARRRSQTPERILARVSEKVKDALVPDELEPGPEPGEWRKQRLAGRRDDRLFHDILVPVSGEEVGWHALEQAILIARREGSRLRGLHVLPAGADGQDPAAERARERFEQRCQELGVEGSLIVEQGPIARTICDRARWNDLVVLNLAHPPGEGVIASLSSGFSAIIQRCPRPILAVPQKTSDLTRALLAYDGSPKADEALYLATYLSSAWEVPVVMVHVGAEEGGKDDALARARAYLQAQAAQATFLKQSGKPAEAILATAARHACDFIIMGGYGHQPVLRAVLGSTADHALRQSDIPILICQ